MGSLWEGAAAAAAGGTVVWLAGARGLRWARARCDEALGAARHLPDPPERTFILVAKPRAGAVSGARAREARVLQQALDDGWRDGVPVSRRAVPPLPR